MPIIFFVGFAVICSVAIATDHSPLQDFYVVALQGSSTLSFIVYQVVYIGSGFLFSFMSTVVFVHGRTCKDPKLAQADDFFFRGLHMPGNTTNTFGSSANLASVARIPGLNTLGLSMARLDYASLGINPPHLHPRATEIFTVLEETLNVGFVTSNPQNRLISRVLQKGDAFVFPVGLIHFERNVGYSNCVAIASLSSQNPGAISIGSAVFRSKPDILARAFQTGQNVTNRIKNHF